jgi:serine/threonine protein kinase
VPEIDKQIKQLHIEANLAIGLHHPNIVRLYGTTKLSGNRFGIVMEKIDSGSLDRYIEKLEHQTAVSISLGVIDGLDYVHSKKIAHRDLKPQNILLDGPQFIPKITDFGVSKVVQTLITNTAMVGTPKYAAPELLTPSCAYGCSADIFSLSVILFEMFSGQKAEQGLGINVMMIMLSIVQGKRPKIPAGFPVELKPLVERGWAHEPKERTNLAEFRSVLQSMLRQESTVSPPVSPVLQNKSMSRVQQSAEVAKVSLPLPVLTLKWNTSCEMLNSQELRFQMVADIKTKSNMARIVNESVLSVMKVIPRHMFLEEKRLDGFGAVKKSQYNQQDIVNAAYLYNKPMPATMSSNESSPEIIGTQLSMTEIIPGQSVLLVGIKGGYIQSLVAQLVGINGSVVTVTSDDTAMKVCRDRVELNCPLKGIIRWIKIKDVKSTANILAILQQEKMLFHTVIYCGSIDQFPLQLTAVLHSAGNASIMAPVKSDDNGGLRFQLYVRRGASVEMRTITDFGVLFEVVH